MNISILTSNELIDIVSKMLKKQYKGKLFEKKLDEIREIIGDRQYVLGQTFYSVSAYMQIDVDEFCDVVFDYYGWSALFEEQEYTTKLQAFVSPHIKSANKVADSSGIERTRFNRLQKGELKELYASEVYGLAKAFSLKPSQLFSYFYGNGKRPVVGV